MNKRLYHIPYKGSLLVGLDEVGRGSLAGPVYAAAVILKPKASIEGLTDSKILVDAKRRRIATLILESALAYGYGRAEVAEIDAINILQASLLAMQRAVASLAITPEYAIVDGIHCPQLPFPSLGIVAGDLHEPAISAASVLAKVARDDEMIRLHQQYPDYHFAQNKGYGTEQHLAALSKHGICEIHRRSFAPCAALI